MDDISTSTNLDASAPAVTQASTSLVILSMIADVTGRDVGTDVKPSIFELGIDSLSVVELIFKLEERLQIDIPFSDLNEESFNSVSTFAEQLDQMTVNQKPGI